MARAQPPTRTKGASDSLDEITDGTLPSSIKDGCPLNSKSVKGGLSSSTILQITEREWQAMRDEFKKSLDKFKVPGREQKELFAIVESTKKDIVVSK